MERAPANKIRRGSLYSTIQLVAGADLVGPRTGPLSRGGTEDKPPGASRAVAAAGDGLVIRIATDDDLRSIVAHYGPGGADSPWDPFGDLERIRRIPRGGLLIAELAGGYVGFAFWYEARKPWYAPEVDRYARISDLHIMPDAQSKGIGRALLREALRRIRAAGIGTVFLETDENNGRAQKLYQSEGFVKVAPSVLRFRLELIGTETLPA